MIEFCRGVNTTSIADTTVPARLAERFTKVGTPPTMSPGERHGFEVLVSIMQVLTTTDGVAFEKELGRLARTDRRDIEAFFAFVATHCPRTGAPVE